jgi:hypothetical protein
LLDDPQNPVQRFIAQHIGGANAQDPHPLLRKPCITSLIVPDLCAAIVRHPIHLNRKPCRGTEIENVRTDRVLPAKS